ncbi:MAG: pentapeptide repeat-containing protein [Pseudomonadota bacterium]
MFTETEKGTRFSIEIPIEMSTFWFFGAWFFFGLLVFVTVFVFNNAIPCVLEQWKEESSAKKSWLTRFLQWMYEENSGIHAIKWLALIAAPFWLFFIGLIIRNFAQLGLNPPSGDDADPRAYYLAVAGTVALLGGLVAAPLALVRVQTVERQTKAQEEGLLTDRINKAVEGMGAEKTEQTIGRSITIYSGSLGTVHHMIPRNKEFEPPLEYSIVESVDPYGEHFDEENREMIPVKEYEVRSWKNSRTQIEWQGKKPELVGDEAIAETGDWQVFSQTVSNLEVRIGAIYALERIAQDSLRDHIQIMEILCAYIRENAPASEAPELPKPPEWFEGENEEGNDFEEAIGTWKTEHRKALEGIKPRADVQTALTVIGRRSRAQKEKEWGEWRPFEEKMPNWPEWCTKEDGNASHDYLDGVKKHEEARDAWDELKPKFRLDLRETNLVKADMSGAAQAADFSLARFESADLQGADFSEAQAQGASFYKAQAQGANFYKAQGADFRSADAQGADFFRADAQGANFYKAQAQGADFFRTDAQGANFRFAKAQGADFSEAQAQGANFSFAHAQGANFSFAQAQGADFRFADAQGANFRLVRLDDETTFTAAEFYSAAVKCDLSMVSLTQTQVSAAFGDEDTRLPDDITRPAHWPDWAMPAFSVERQDDLTFPDQWNKWKADPDNYTPPPKPEEKD